MNKIGENSADVALILPMIPEMELTATKTAEAVGTFMALDQDKIDEIKIALIEACINAFEHSQSKDGLLKIDFDFEDDALTIVISDRGHGFDVQTIEERRRRRREKGQRRGWGLTLIHELMDYVDIDSGQNGTTVTMIKRR